ncbi:lipase 3 precursor [Metarhizium guizhouense ARSEF 977]|uniref:Lipase 3 n=1 Tax=Metarhizium guizhouense (strain ARSEF 977) TaxID=1276136 RepID=A0A0B4GYX0_METGA|nr:lipase 3 precursor [Metarhizium guizhouense ARSEF 977]
MALKGGNAIYKGKPLFRGAMMDSGTGVPADPVDSPQAQAVYETVLKAAGCDGAKNDTLSCLRGVPYDTFFNAVTKPFPSAIGFYGSKISFPPRSDGRVLLASPEQIAANGSYHHVPMIVGDQEDEGTLFAIYQESIKTDDDLVKYFADNYYPRATKEQLSELVGTYSKAGDEGGSPFRTGTENALYPKYKQISAMLGDTTFTLARRRFLDWTNNAHPETPSWSYLASYLHGLPYLGTYHTSDINQVFNGMPPSPATISNRRYYFNFLYDLDPNGKHRERHNWPQWRDNLTLMWFKTQFESDYTPDTFRTDQYNSFVELSDVLRQ